MFSSAISNLSFSSDGQCPGHLSLGALQAGRVVKLTGRVLEAQPEQLATRRVQVLAQLAVGKVAQLRRVHASSRITNLVRMGSLCPARRMASRASGSGTPASSNITRPGL